MIVVPSWEGQGQLKTLGTLVLVKQTLALKSRDTRHNSAGWCWLSQCYSSAEWTVRTEEPSPPHLAPVRARHESSWAQPSPSSLLGLGMSSPPPGVLMGHDQDERNHSEALCFGYGRNVYCIERYIYIFGCTFDPPQLSLHFYSNLPGKLILIWDATSS